MKGDEESEVEEQEGKGGSRAGRGRRREGGAGSDGGYEPIGNSGTYGTRLTDVKDSHRSSIPTLIGKTRTLNKDDDGDDFCVINFTYYFDRIVDH